MRYSTINPAIRAANRASRKTGQEYFVVLTHYQNDIDKTYQICDEYDLDGFFQGEQPIYSTME